MRRLIYSLLLTGLVVARSHPAAAQQIDGYGTIGAVLDTSGRGTAAEFVAGAEEHANRRIGISGDLAILRAGDESGGYMSLGGRIHFPRKDPSQFAAYVGMSLAFVVASRANRFEPGLGIEAGGVYWSSPNWGFFFGLHDLIRPTFVPGTPQLLTARIGAAIR